MSATPDSILADSERLIADLQRQLAECRADRDEALRREAAAAEILQVINASGGDLAPVFDAMLERALQLCEAVCGQLATFDGDTFEFVAVKGDPRWLEQYPRGRLPASRGLTWSRIVAGDPYVHILDAQDTEAYRSGHQGARDTVVTGGRTYLTVALRREQALLGALTIYRREVRPFSDQEIALLQNFAVQAVIAMENARLLTETREALEQQTATAEVLQVINSSPGDLAPVFEAVLEKAHALCGAAFGGLMAHEGEAFRVVAAHGDPQFVEYWQQGLIHPPEGSPLDRVMRGEAVAHITDAIVEDTYRTAPAYARLIDLGRVRTFVIVPLRKEDALLGVITAFRQEVRPFTDKQIALLQNFAAQAVIAMENARLLTETREALEQQQAIAEILQVINRSPGELQPVFDILLEKAMQLCGAAFGVLAVLEGEQTHTVAARGLPPALAEWRRTHSVISPRNTLLARVLEGEPYVHSLDLKDDHLYRQGEPLRRANVDLGGARSSLYVPLLRGCDVLGTVHLYRQEVRPFTDQQIALLQNIAAQAVIAMENARLLTETREALDQQTATAEVLGVINSSPGDLAPVFEAALDKALDLCGAAFGTLWICEGDLFRAAALRRVPKPYAEFLARQPIRPAAGSSVLGQLFAGNAFAHVLDVASDAAYQNDSAAARSLIQLGGFRTVAGVPLRKDGKLLGAITIYRREVRAFTDKQIALLQNFAAQAVIAMENARLLGETREALEQQTATAEVLQVINSSPGDLAPVFDAMLEKALRLCEAAFGNLWTYDGEASRLAAIHGASPEYRAELLRAGPQKPEPGGALIRLVEGEPLVHIADITSGAAYRSGNAARRRMADRSGARTVLWVPMRKEGVLLGFFAIYRTEVRPFTDKQIALLQNFAAQAVIAMENARLITETRKALEQQTATAEVLGVINSSPGDLAPVFDTMVDTAARLCGTNMAGLAIRVGDAYRYVATRSLNPEWDSCVRSSSFKPERGTATGRTLLERRIIHVADLAADPEQTVPEIVSVGGIRTFLGVPLLREGEPIGVLALARQHVEPFSEQQIALVGTFAAQAVIAMENARLLAETREALEQQTATAEVLGVINSSPGDLSPVFEAMLEKAMRLCAAAFGYLMTYDGERFHPVAQRGLPPPFADYLAGMDQPGPSGAYARVRAGTPLVHIADLMEGEVYRTSPLRRALVDLGGARTGIVIALRKEDTLLGVFTIYRQEVRPFTEKQIALLENFAAQAVIAIENARLLTETREALEQQTATAEVLQVINSSPGDLGPVFDAMLQKAMRLCDAAFGSFLTFDGERFLAVVHRGVPAELMESLRQPQSATPGGSFARLVRGEPIVHLADIADDDGYRRGLRGRVAMVDIGGARTAVWVALRKDEALLGALVLYRQQVRPFSDKQIALLENFAAQAVIAIENARLLGELRLRTDDLQESLEYQTATSEVLKVISRAGAALEPVLQTLTETAARMCQADRAALNQLADGAFRTTAVFGFSQEFRDHRARIPILADRSTVTGRMAVERRVIHIEDVWTDPELTAPGRTQTWRLGQFRTALAVPLLRDDAVIGGFFLARLRVEPFTDRQIELVQTFADQAVIAIENARLITETREALERQTATAEILEVINRSPGDLGPVFEAILDRAHRLCGASNGTLFLREGARFRPAAMRGVPEPIADRLRGGVGAAAPLFRPLLASESFVHIVDMAETDHPMIRLARDWGVRALLSVPLRTADELVGVIVAARFELRPFSDKEIGLLENFAAQAVIAMDNARLLNEIRRRQAELRVTFDNMGDGVAMFDAEQRLAAWNRNFQELLDLPDDFLAGRPSFADYFHYLAARGEYGSADREAELGRFIEDTEREVRFERTRPDGRVIEVRRNAVPGGGSVLIYGDITERKRAEAEIHAAREAAERALRELQTAQASLLHAQKMAALGQLTAGIAHEIKNPLNFVNNFAGLSVDLLSELKETVEPAMVALDQSRRAEVDEVVQMLTGNLARIAEHGRRADGIVTSMLAHSRGGSSERQSVDVNAIVEEALNLAYHGARAQDLSFNITLERELDRGIAPIELVPQEVMRVFLNLFGNGFYAANQRRSKAGDPQFKPCLKVTTRDLGGAVEIRVRDNGTGIVPEQRDKLFQPFFTTKPTGEGTGLGLSISWDIVTQQHGGTIEVDSRAGEFTEFTIRLPRAYRASAEAAS